MDATVAKVGSYLIDRQLGRGGMGIVYAGRHEVTGARAAVKTVIGADSRRLFQIRREIDALARLAHPGVVRILGHGVDGGFPWYAMDLLEGLTLEGVHRRFLEGPHQATLLYPGDETTTGLPWSAPTTIAPDRMKSPDAVAPAIRSEAAGGNLAEAMGLVVRLCETLAFVHGEGVIHRDLKPSNIFVTARGLPVLVDFGLVAHVGGVTGRDVLDETWVAGSCLFMAPEQISGELLDPRADLYALGCVMYLLITGRPPFSGTAIEVMSQHLQAPAVPPSAIVDGVPRELEQLVLELLAKDPRDRVGHAHDVAAALQRLRVNAPAWGEELPRTRAYLYRPPLVGRQAAIDQIDAHAKGLVEGRGGVVLLGGESGVGKTRVALEIASRVVARGQEVTTSVCAPTLPPLGPLRPLLQRIADYCIEHGAAVSQRLVGEHGPVMAMYEPALSGIPGQEKREAPAPLPQAAARARLFGALSETLAVYAAAIPTLLVVDDLQWADDLTGAFLEHLSAGPIVDMRLVVLGTYRTEERTPALEQLLAATHTAGLTLTRLSTDYVGAMVAGMLSLPTPPAAFVRFLADKTEGNPFFLAEYLRTAVSEQVLIRTPSGHWTFAESNDPTDVICESLPLPRSLREVISRRLETLSPRAAGVLRSAAVIGREFDLGVLQHVAGLEEHELTSALTELVDRHVIENTEAGGFRISHDKLREISYAELGDAERRSLHGRAASALDALHRGDDRFHGVLGDHWSRAGAPALAAPLLERAGDRALTLYAPADAIGFYRHALGALEAGGAAGPTTFGVREKLADALAVTGRYADARAVFAQAVASAPSGVEAARLHRKTGKTLETEHDHAQALDAFGRAERSLLDAIDRDASWHREWVQVQLNRIWIFYWQNRTDDMNQLVERVAPAVNEHGSALQRSNYYQALVTRDFRQRRYVVADDVIANARRSLSAAEEARAPVESVFARFVLGFGLLFAGQLDEAEAQLVEALQGARRLGDVTSGLRCQAYLALTQRRQQRLQDAEASAEQTLALATSLKMGDYVGLAQSILGWAAWKRGAMAEARRLSQAAMESWDQLNFPYPFRWTGVLTLLAVQLANVPLRVLVGIVEPLLAPGQLRLPEPVNAALEKAVAAYGRQDSETTREELQRAVDEARLTGFL